VVPAGDRRASTRAAVAVSVAAAAALSMVLLHRPDGGQVAVSPSHVVSLHARAPTSAANKAVTAEARCILWLADGKILSVTEPCELVRRLLEEAGGK